MTAVSARKRRIEKYSRSGSTADGGVGETPGEEDEAKSVDRQGTTLSIGDMQTASSLSRKLGGTRGDGFYEGGGQSNARRLIVGKGNARIMAE